MSDLAVFVILDMSLFCILFFNVTVNAASVFSEAKFLDCLHHFFDGVLCTFHHFYNLHKTFILVSDFDKLSS